MAHAASQGREVFVALLTSGDGFVEDAARYYLSLDVTPDEYVHMGYERQIETKAALAELGVPEDHIYFLGFPDGGLDSLWLTHWNGDRWTSTTTGYDHVPYLTAWRPEIAYQGRMLLDALTALYLELQPTQLIMPSAVDTHPDHWGTNAFATLAWAELAQHHARWQSVARWGYLVHWPAWPLPLAYRPAMPAEAPDRLAALAQEPWHQETLDRASTEKKRAALMRYESQVELIKPFMLAFCRSSEVYAVESSWQGTRSGSAMQVRNPPVDRVSRTLGRANPLSEVLWDRDGDRDVALVTLNPRVGGNSQVEVSLHPVDGQHRHFRWLAGAPDAPAEVELTHQNGALRISWPSDWIGTAPRVMAGVQVHAGGKSQGKIPFRIIPWGDFS